MNIPIPIRSCLETTPQKEGSRKVCTFLINLCRLASIYDGGHTFAREKKKKLGKRGEDQS